jgi:hypothetical protein
LPGQAPRQSRAPQVWHPPPCATPFTLRTHYNTLLEAQHHLQSISVVRNCQRKLKLDFSLSRYTLSSIFRDNLTAPEKPTRWSQTLWFTTRRCRITSSSLRRLVCIPVHRVKIHTLQTLHEFPLSPSYPPTLPIPYPVSHRRNIPTHPQSDATKSSVPSNTSPASSPGTSTAPIAPPPPSRPSKRPKKLSARRAS